MASAILPVTKRNPVVKQYELSDADQRAMRALADEPCGKIPHKMLLKIERQRIRFINFNGSAFGL
ncbi:MAG: hypothetical protein PHI29_01585 [Gallionella sp.]|nr:hypothetical protein [Gallionella sp.]